MLSVGHFQQQRSSFRKHEEHEEEHSKRTVFLNMLPLSVALLVAMDPTCCDSAAPGGSTVQVCFPGARAAVLDNLNRQREEGRLCDLSIQVQGRVFSAHRCVLAASSPYFHDQVHPWM